VVLSYFISYRSIEPDQQSYLQDVAAFDVLAKPHDPVTFILEWWERSRQAPYRCPSHGVAASVTFKFLLYLAGNPTSTNTLLQELFSPLRMPYRIAPAENSFICVIYKTVQLTVQKNMGDPDRMRRG
jgi:hypothetical protein